jgi:DNA-binding MarR family transcriptional regulator
VQYLRAVQATDEQLAQDLLEIWMWLVRGTVGRSLGQLEELGLGLPQLKTLDALADCDCEPTVKDLAERLGLSLPGMSRNVDGLLRKGYVERREDDSDRRMKRLRLTAAGHDVITRVNAVRLEGLQDFVATLAPEQREPLAAALAPVAEGLRG